jgi:acetyl esterase/lipase
MNRSHGWVFFLLLLLTGCSAFDVVNTMVPRCGYRRTSNIAYGILPRQTLDVYQPKDAKPSSSIVIFFYGGSWSSGNKDNYLFVGQALASRGFIAVLPNYRLYPSVAFPAFVQDGALAVRWVHDHATELGGDPNHIYLMGHSAGAHIAALITLDGRYLNAVGLDRSNIRATAGLSGPYDFRISPKYRPALNIHSTTAPVNPDVEPILFADGHEPPMLLLQGGKDHIVDPANATRLADRIDELGGEAKVILYPNLGHVGVVAALAWPFRWLAPVLDDTTTFFHQH